MKTKKITTIAKCSHSGCENRAKFTKNNWSTGGFYNFRQEKKVFCSGDHLVAEPIGKG